MITLDIEPVTKVNRNERQVSANLALRSFFDLHHDRPRRTIEIWLSASGKHFHLIRHGDDGTLAREFRLRERFGDDMRRVRIDRWKRKHHSHNFNVLWTKKNGKLAKKISLRTLKRIARGKD